MKEQHRCGTVYLVGAGPGDPGLLTVKGYELLCRCDVVIYDALVNPAILALVRREAERIFVGPAHGSARLTQEEIVEVMIARARRGGQVVRLKGGDPFIFGRGGEEALALTRAGVPWEVVPGVSAGHGVPTWAKIPLTHRGLASSVVFVTGHECAQKDCFVQWSKLAQAADTLVIFMGAQSLPFIVEALLRGGRPPSTPLAVIERGTWPEERVRVATLGTVREMIAADPVRSPALGVVGDVVSLRALLEPDANQEGVEVFDDVLSGVS